MVHYTSYLLVVFSIGAPICSGSTFTNKNNTDVDGGNSFINSTSNNGQSSDTNGHKGSDLFPATLPFAAKPIGLIECQDATPETAKQFFEQILGKDGSFNESNYLCGPTCRGKCVPRPNHVGIPPSIYPFGCSCDMYEGCDAKGPIVSPIENAPFKIVCKSDRRCTCVGVGPGQFLGYTCSFLNTLTGRMVTYAKKKVNEPGSEVGAPPKFGSRFFPLEWCSCCPNLPILKKGDKRVSR